MCCLATPMCYLTTSWLGINTDVREGFTIVYGTRDVPEGMAEQASRRSKFWWRV